MIRVIDSIMGSGKTTGIFNYMKKNKGRRYLYISVFLDEVGDGNIGKEGRIQKELPSMKFAMPKNKGEGKVVDLKKLIKRKQNIASTHALFRIFDREVVNLLIANNYVLIIDEAVDCVSRYKGINSDDINLLEGSDSIYVDDKGIVRWNEEEQSNYSGVFNEIRDLCALGNLFIYKNKMCMWEYPPKLLKELPDVFVLSYLFEGSMMRSWLDINEITWKKENLPDYNILDNNIIKAQIRENLQLLSHKKIDKVRQLKKPWTFSATWYKNASNDDFKYIKSIFESIIRQEKPKAGEIFWTTYKGGDITKEGKRKDGYIRDKIAGKGYKLGLSEDIPPFLSFNTKATNKYKDFWLCLYGVNPNKDPSEVSYVEDKGVEFNKDLYSLSEMLQFLWRGCIRQGKPMKVLILSDRMENLLTTWLKEDE